MSVAALSDHPFPLSDVPRGRNRLSKPFVIALTLSVAAHAGVGAYLAYKKFVMPTEAFEPDVVEGVFLYPPPPPPPKPVDNPEPQPKPTSQVRLHQPEIPPPLFDVTPLPADPKPLVLAEGPRLPPVNLDAGEPTPPLPKPPSVISSPDWLRKPTSAQMANAFPDRALRRNISGKATLTCKVTAVGAVRDCAVVSETPSEYGFGSAALSVTKHFKMKPQTVDGQAVDGASVRIPMSFNLAED